VSDDPDESDDLGGSPTGQNPSNSLQCTNFIEPQRTEPPGYFEHGFDVILTQNGQVAVPRPGEGRDERYGRNRQDPVPTPRHTHQQTGTSPTPSPGYPPPMPSNARNASDFGTSRPLQGPLSNWGSQSMLPPSRPVEEAPYYNGLGSDSNMTRRFNGQAVQQQQRPPPAYDTSLSTVPSVLRPSIQPGSRPLTDWENRPPPSGIYRPRPLPQTPQQHSASTAPPPKQISTPTMSVSSDSGPSLISRTAAQPTGPTVRIDATRPSPQVDSSRTKLRGGRAEEVTPDTALDTKSGPNVPETIQEDRQRRK
jgi:hypothetical protein